MKCVIFICLLSLSMCLSNQITEEAAKNDKAQAVPELPKPAPTDKVATPTNNTPKIDPPKEAKDASITTPATHTESTPKPDNSPKPAEKSDKDKEITTTTVPPNNNTQTTTTEKAAPVSTTTASNTSVPDTDDKSKSKITTTTPKAEVVSTTTETPKEDKLLKARAFDGPSFIGGMILTLGLLAIGFMGFKYYKNQTERNYHTL